MSEAHRRRVASSAICELFWKLEDKSLLRGYLDAIIDRRYQDVDIPLVLDELHLQHHKEQAARRKLTEEAKVERHEMDQRLKARVLLMDEFSAILAKKIVA